MMWTPGRGILLLALSTALLLPAGQALELFASGQPTYAIQYEPEVEILTLESHGGMRGLGPRFRLFGDGKVVREMVHHGTGEILRVDQGYLAPENLDPLIRKVIEAGLPEMTTESFRQAAGGQIPLLFDMPTMKLQLHFDRYQRPGEPAITPFEATVYMEAPSVLAELYLPHLPQPHGFVALWNTLESAIPVPAKEAYENPRGPG